MGAWPLSTRPDSSSSAKVKAVLGRRSVRPTGDWQLYVEVADWKAIAGPCQVSRLSEAHERDRVLGQLDGQRLLNVRFNQQAATWVLDFDLGSILTIGPSVLAEANDGSHPDGAQWTLFYWGAGNVA